MLYTVLFGSECTHYGIIINYGECPFQILMQLSIVLQQQLLKNAHFSGLGGATQAGQPWPEH